MMITIMAAMTPPTIESTGEPGGYNGQYGLKKKMIELFDIPVSEC